MDNAIYIETERYRIHVLRPEDVTVEYCKWMNNPQTSEFIESSSQQHTIEDLKIYVKEKLTAPDCVMFGIFDRHSGTHVGNIKYDPLDFADRSAVMGVLIGNPSHRGVGAFGEVFAATKAWLTEEFRIQTILLGVDINNTAAVRAYEKYGFTRLPQVKPSNIMMKLSL